MDQPSRAPLELQRTSTQNSANQQGNGLQHVPDFALMPYELAEIQECSQSQEQAFSDGDEDAALGVCHWQAIS